jgi:MFS family permease
MATLLGLLAFSGMVVEGAAADWSGVHLGEVIGARGGVLALGYAGFSAAMAIGRLFGDRLVQRAGPVRVVRWGGTIAVAGLILVVTGFGPVAVIAGWLLAGAGVSGVSPQIFTAAGNLDPGSSGAALARAATLGYFGFLAGPPLIGMAATLAGLSAALIIPAVLAAVVASAAAVVRRRDTEQDVVAQSDSARTG